MTPETLTGKLTAGAVFGGAAKVVPAAFLGAFTARARAQTKKKKKKQEGGFLKLFSSAAKAGYEVGNRKDYKRMGAKRATGHYKVKHIANPGKFKDKRKVFEKLIEAKRPLKVVNAVIVDLTS